MRRRLLLPLAVAALVIGTVPGAGAQSGQAGEDPTGGAGQEAGEEAPPGDIPSVGVLPVPTGSSDPNAGQWFLATLSPGQTTRVTARVVNPATVDQTVRLSLADLDFGPNGTPEVANVSDDVGTWGAFDQPRMLIPAGETVVAEFSITAPEGAEPGDHVGVVLVESEPQGSGAIRVVKRVATRLYVTVPGDAQPAFVIEEVAMERDSGFLTREITFTVLLRNTGRVRLRPTVTIDGHEATGSELLMSRSVEPYTATLSVPVWGGPLRYKVEVTSATETFAGPTRAMRVSTFVFPWILLFSLFGAGALVLGVRRLLRRRNARYEALRADLRRLEKLMSEQQGEPGNTGAGEAPDRRQEIMAAMKRAVRAGDGDTEARLREKLDELEPLGAEPVAVAVPAKSAEPAKPARRTNGHRRGAPPAGDGRSVEVVLRELRRAPASRRDALVEEALGFEVAELRQHRDLIAKLPAPARRPLVAATRLRARSREATRAR